PTLTLQKKSREESSGEGSGVEILANRPYSDGPGGSGQYTHKIYHVGSHIPSWFRALLPKAALQVEEESWNAYPYTRTRYTCPFVEKFSIEIETYYRPDAGQQTNIFNLSAAEKRQRILGACSRGVRQDPGLSLLTLCFRDRLSYPRRGKCPYPELPAQSRGSAGDGELGNRVPILSSASPAPLGLCTVSFPVPGPPALGAWGRPFPPRDVFVPCCCLFPFLAVSTRLF
ncbi:hypothetical protein CIB84_017420, partial [Bambusicola thoracicus]